MTISINQVIVICLIVILVVFLVFMGKLVVEALGLLKTVKRFSEKGSDLMDSYHHALDTVETKVNEAADTIIKDATPATKIAVVIAGVIIALNIGNGIRKRLLAGGGFIAALAERNARRKAEKELRKSRKEIRRLRANAKAEKKMAREARRIAREARKY